MAFQDPNANSGDVKPPGAVPVTVPGLNPAASTPLAQPVKSASGQEDSGLMGAISKAGGGQAAPAASSSGSMGGGTPTSGSTGSM